MPNKQNTSVVVFLGGGRITSALVAGLRLMGDGRRIVVYDRHPQKVRKLQRQLRVEMVRHLKTAVQEAKLLLFAVRPASMSGILREVANCGALPGLCVSLAAGVPLRELQRGLGSPARWVRAMPSPVCRAGRGLTALCFDRSVATKERNTVRRFFARVGQVVEVSELRFDTFTATYSSSHGYHALATLAQAAHHAGLDRKTALQAAAHALADGIQYWRDSGGDLNNLLQEAATPGGIAATTMQAMDRAGYARAVASGIRAGIRQAQRNARR